MTLPELEEKKKHYEDLKDELQAALDIIRKQNLDYVDSLTYVFSSMLLEKAPVDDRSRGRNIDTFLLRATAARSKLIIANSKMEIARNELGQKLQTAREKISYYKDEIRKEKERKSQHALELLEKSMQLAGLTPE